MTFEPTFGGLQSFLGKKVRFPSARAQPRIMRGVGSINPHNEGHIAAIPLGLRQGFTIIQLKNGSCGNKTDCGHAIVITVGP